MCQPTKEDVLVRLRLQHFDAETLMKVSLENPHIDVGMIVNVVESVKKLAELAYEAGYEAGARSHRTPEHP